MVLKPLQQHDLEQFIDCDWLIGIDEAGRGALAGPVVAGACVIHRSFFESAGALELSAGINDSKQLAARERETYLGQIKAMSAEGLLDFAVASGSVEEIAEHNILGATRLAMRRAVDALAVRTTVWSLPEQATAGPLFSETSTVRLIVDGRPLKPFPYAHHGIVKGDGKSLSIAMASIAAKVTRDRELQRLAADYPGYGLEGHKGYATKSHRAAILAHGASPIHRELFLRKILASESGSESAESCD